MRLLLIGGGDHCFSLLSEISSETIAEIIGVIDTTLPRGMEVFNNISISGNDQDSAGIIKDEGITHFLITLGSVKYQNKRQNLFDFYKNLDIIPFTYISKFAYTFGESVIGQGTAILKSVILSSNTVIGENCILNTGCIIEHNVKIGAHTHIAPGAVILGGAEIGRRVMIGANAAVRQYVRICDDAVVGMGSVVVDNIEKQGIWVGNPAHFVVKGDGN